MLIIIITLFSLIISQISGKSTLLNCLYNLNFAVASNRTTKGVHLQLIKVLDNNNLDYIYLLDTEGLRSIEHHSGDIKKRNVRDNQMATFIIGLSDMCLINLEKVCTTITNADRETWYFYSSAI